jgi:hypothetical protein
LESVSESCEWAVANQQFLVDLRLEH